MKYFIFSLIFVQSLCFALCFAETNSATQEKKPTKCLWIGCAASHVAPGQCLGLAPDQLCVHTNLANLFVANDPSAESSLQHALESENITQIVVCGTYGCPGVQKALTAEQPAGSWLHAVRAIYIKNKADLDKIQDEQERVNRLVELNVLEQVQNLRSTPIVQEVFKKKQPFTIIGIVHGPNSTTSRELVCISTTEEIKAITP